MKKIIKKIPFIRKIIQDRDNLLAERDNLKIKLESFETEDLKSIKEKLDSLNFKTNLIMDHFIDPCKALPATGNVRNAQLEMTNMFKAFKLIMDKHKIDYWLDFGTLLGAVRHKGFIPWDTDLDISIMKNDLKNIKEFCKNELPDKYEFINFWKGHVYRIIERNNKNGLFIDVYPYVVYGKDKHGIEKIIRTIGIPTQMKEYRSHKPLPKNIIFPLSTVNFESIKCKAPNEIDTYLKFRYGNYSKLPKKEHPLNEHISIDSYIEFYPEDKIIKLKKKNDK